MVEQWTWISKTILYFVKIDIFVFFRPKLPPSEETWRWEFSCWEPRLTGLHQSISTVKIGRFQSGGGPSKCSNIQCHIYLYYRPLIIFPNHWKFIVSSRLVIIEDSKNSHYIGGSQADRKMIACLPAVMKTTRHLYSFAFRWRNWLKSSNRCLAPMEITKNYWMKTRKLSPAWEETMWTK